MNPSIMALQQPETLRERHLRMLLQVLPTCTACSMCELGLKPAVRGLESRDPHVFSSMNPSKYFLVGQGPGWHELKERQPFVGAAGNNLDEQLAKNGMSRADFYITNTVRCFITDNAAPTYRHIQRCKPFLHIEINLLRPELIITLGSVAFGAMCPDLSYRDSLGTLVTSKEFDVPVFPVYHPSPLNMADADRKIAFAKQVAIICAVIKRQRAQAD